MKPKKLFNMNSLYKCYKLYIWAIAILSDKWSDETGSLHGMDSALYELSLN